MTAAQSATPTLEAQSRSVTGKSVKALRREGVVPGVIYGHNQSNVSLSLDARTFTKLYHAAGSTTLINLTIDGKAPVKVLVHDVQTHPVRHEITHVDFYQVNLKEKLTTEIPLNFTGVADAVDILGGSLITVKDAVEVECLPDDLVQEIEVDITPLKTFDDTLTVANIVAPKGITILDDAEQTILSVAEPRSEEEMAELDEAPAAENETEFETKDGVEAAPAEGEEKAE